ncbi:Spo0E family sporulation regulatory protein-aspartic acid phosphatase [Roseburia sp. 499]|uniref:Spo0E family sporulation regulatory protein-aspartic acid phosphatase n=1 Tax=Roseburia sp. 499 TaxID=1261634 RepID=UPI00095292C9|nr:Spo0E family sporulation regulatory protein-aspartic acid phosphatase [Roseburia sp. 499]WVK70967.1 Spo0E family sporulation regulatory protein-aspartic acid phosphatase [Roseburia sp. 499]
MRHLLELKREIESVREELDVAVQNGVEGTECYEISLQLDSLIADYMQLKEDKIQLRNCS